MQTSTLSRRLAPDYSSNSFDFHNKSLSGNQPLASDLSYEEDSLEEEYQDMLPTEDINYLRDFLLSSALYVEQLESALCERSDEFWESREHAYRIITGLMIDLYTGKL